MNTLGDVIKEMQGLLGDPDGDWVEPAYATPFINIVYGSQYIRIKNACGQSLEAVVPVPNVPAGTTSLAKFQAQGQPLCGLYSPDEVWAKPAGQPIGWFRKGRGPMQLPHISLPGLPVMNGWAVLNWDWLGNQLLISPINAELDLEVWGRFNPPPLVDEDDVLVVDGAMWVATGLGAAAMAGVERANPQILAGYKTEADARCDDIAAELVRQLQPNPIRTKRMDRNLAGFYGWRWR